MKTLRKFMPIFLLIGIFGTACQEKQLEDTCPNILFCISDDQSFPHAGAYGCDWVKTPAFDRVATDGLLFTNAFTPISKCSPSRAAIITGRNPWQLEAAANHWPLFPGKFKTYAEALKENGYFTGFTSKGWGPGGPGEINGKERALLGPAFNRLQTEPPTKPMNVVDYAANFEDFLNQRPDDAPFCFWYGPWEPHRAYEFRSGVNKGGKSLKDIDSVYDFWPDSDTVRHDLLDYAFEIEYFDQHVGRMLQTLEERDLLDNTLVIVTSDNAMPFPRMKGMANTVSNRLPLAMMWPAGIEDPGRVVEGFVNFTDFAPTFLELAGIPVEESGMEPTEGQSLLPVFQGAETARDFVVFGKERTDLGRPGDVGYPVRAIANHEYVYIRNFHPERWPAGNPETGYRDTDLSPTKLLILNDRRRNGTSYYWDENFGKRPAEELYRVVNDPYGLHNLADDPTYQAVKHELNRQMTVKLKAEQDPRMLGNGDIFDTYLYDRAEWRNLYERYMDGEDVSRLIRAAETDNILVK